MSATFTIPVYPYLVTLTLATDQRWAWAILAEGNPTPIATGPGRKTWKQSLHLAEGLIKADLKMTALRDSQRNYRNRAQGQGE